MKNADVLKYGMSSNLMISSLALGSCAEYLSFFFLYIFWEELNLCFLNQYLSMGLDLTNGTTRNNLEAGVIEPAMSKVKIIQVINQSRAELAC